MKVLLVANSDWFLRRFEGELMAALRDAGASVVLVSPPGPHVEALEAAGFPWRPVPMWRRGIYPWRELRTVAALRRVYRRERPDLVHHFTLKCVLYGALAAWLAAVPAVVGSITGLGYLYATPGLRVRLLRGVVEGLLRPLLPRSHAIFLNRDDLELYRRRRLVATERSFLVRGSGVDVDRFTPQPWPPPDPRGPLVVLPARMLWSKGVGEVVEASRRLRRRGVAVRVALVGAADPEHPDAVPEARIADWRRRDLVEWWGFREDMLEVYRRATVVCLPTTYGEGVPTVLLEAAACGRPVIATDVPGCREAVVDGETGRLVPPADPGALASAIAELAVDPRRCREMGERGRRRVVADFSTARVVADTLAVYRRAGVDLGSARE